MPRSTGGAKVFGDSEAISLSYSGKRWHVKTLNGSVRSDCVIFCTNAYTTNVAPQFNKSFYPLLAYAISTKPLSREFRSIVMPSGVTLAQEPINLHPLIIDKNGKIIVSGIPYCSYAHDAKNNFSRHLAWIRRVWPEMREETLAIQNYWTGRVAYCDKNFPGVYNLGNGLFGLMHFNGSGNIMCPLLGMSLGRALAVDRFNDLPFPLEKPAPVNFRNKQQFFIRRIMVPAANFGEQIRLI